MNREKAVLLISIGLSGIVVGVAFWMSYHPQSQSAITDGQVAEPTQEYNPTASSIPDHSKVVRQRKGDRQALSAPGSELPEVGPVTSDVEKPVHDEDGTQEQTEEQIPISSQETKKGRPYPVYRGWPDTPENRELLIRSGKLDELSNYHIQMTAPTVPNGLNDTLQRRTSGKISDSELEEQVHSFLTHQREHVKRVYEIREEKRNILEQLRASRRYYDELYGYKP